MNRFYMDYLFVRIGPPIILKQPIAYIHIYVSKFSTYWPISLPTSVKYK